MRRFLREERGQASAELVGMLGWLLLCALVVWQIMLAAWTVDQTANAARTGSRVVGRGGDGEKAAKNALPQALRDGAKVDVTGAKVTVKVKFPIILPGLQTDKIHPAERSAELPS